MKIQIKNRWTLEVIFECDAESTGIAVKMAIEKKVSLARADLVRANLADANLADANLTGANLARADLADANLTGADLARADLADANLTGANLARADLTGANLAGAYLARADLADANLTGANLADANLVRANLADANLVRANLADANLADANLAGADLARADLADATLARATLAGAKATPQDCEKFFQIPQEGELIGWGKKGGILVKMRVPPEAKRTGNLRNRKCRAEWVEVLEVVGNESAVVKNSYGETLYVTGQITKPHAYDHNGFEDCAPGIHFWLTRQEAEDWT